MVFSFREAVEAQRAAIHLEDDYHAKRNPAQSFVDSGPESAPSSGQKNNHFMYRTLRIGSLWLDDKRR